MRPAAALTVLSCLLVAGCGGSDGAQQATTGAEGGQTLEQLWRAPGDDVAVIQGTQTHQTGAVRLSFLVVDKDGAVVARPTAHVWVSTALDQPPFLSTEAKLERVGVPGGDEADATHIYVTSVRLSKPARYWMLAEPDGGHAVQALGNVDVLDEDPPPDPGDPAPRPRFGRGGAGRRGGGAALRGRPDREVPSQAIAAIH